MAEITLTRTIQVVNPATEEIVGEVPRGTAEDADRAVAAANAAFAHWRKAPGIERCAALHRVAGELRTRKEHLARTVTREMGRPLLETLDEVEWCAMVFDYYAELGRHHIGHAISPGQRGQVNYTVREPYGVVVAIVPWNYPLLLMTWKIAPALAAGNAVIVKPSELSPLSALEAAACFAHLPEGLFQIVTGYGPEVGEPLIEHPGTHKITFTGSTPTGKRIMALCAERLKKVSLELGGSDPLIVCDDVDPEIAARGAAWGAFLAAGQVCTSIKRIYVMEGVADPFIAKLTEKVAALRVGDPFGPDVDMGPLVSEQQLSRLETQVSAMREAGGRFLTGARRPDRKGWFYEPTLVADLPPDHPVCCQEVFGPVRPVWVVKDLDEAIARANAGNYGLGASIMTTSLERALLAASEVKAGTFWVNDPLSDNHAAPFGGMKQSGLGRELGAEGLDAFCDVKHVHINLKSEAKHYWFPYDWAKGRGKPS
ncbi:MAG: aldehyde dehydrogenase [Candidatus Sericytochromatia bacterium]|uniref:Aldehyde dehydrogenase n=1 Tax=Candidatus Tanganyikabacteria bacterium TaxID=2961651 RepID=A0A938BP47_9BACT|nr:aldehyde dehydrogenase [Candidatus Tanganyikabacteria bacterium]